MQLKVPPPVYFALFACLMWVVTRTMPALAFAVPWSSPLAVLFALLGVVIMVMGAASFHRVGTTVHPRHPERASALVVTGVYRYTRNPMYLGFALLLSGWAVVLSHLGACVLVLGFIGVITYVQIMPEERALGVRFGEAYAAYKRSVRRWI